MDAGGNVPTADAVCDGGDLDCGSGLLLIIRDAMRPVLAGGVLEVRSRETSVKEDLPAWCRLVGHTLLDVRPGEGASSSYFIRKKAADEALTADLERARSFAWTARVRWTEGMQAKAFVRNHAFDVGQPASFETRDPAPSAVEYLLAALGGCLAVGFQWRASRRGIAVHNLEVSLKAQADNILVFLGIEAQGHPGLKRVEGTLYVEADAEEDALQALWEETLLRSPLTQSLVRHVPVQVALKRA
ncbi:MAG TPA: OsmC family protein [Candidatus Sulfotelmatobacter sp.]|nr:OsmC family protein [Candidatus Sulfotelmatobacter sp.]